MQPVELTLFAALLMGIVFGAGPCAVTCLPYLGPVFISESSAGRQAWGAVVLFSAGRLFGYSLLAVVAGSAGYAATRWFEQGPAAWLLGFATFSVGLLLLSRRRSGHCGAVPASEVKVALPGRRRRGIPLGLFGMGAAMALNPCVPLGSVLLAAAATADPWLGGSLGLAFGFGAVIFPALLFGLVVAHLGTQLRLHLIRWRGFAERGAGLMLILMGTATAFGWVNP